MPLSIRSAPSAASRLRRRGLRRRHPPAAQPRRGRRDRGRDGPYAVLVLPRPGAHRRAADRVQPELRRAGELHDRRPRPASRRTAGSARASRTSRTSTRTATSCPPRTASGSSSWATGCGIPTARSARCRRSIRCSPARVIPSWGGNTEFADMRAAYDALDARTKAEVEDLVCEHSLIYSRAGDRLHRAHRRGDRGVQAGAPAPGARAPGHRPQVAVPLVARRRDRRLDGARGAHVPARPDRARDPAASSSTRTPGGPTTW